jgi:antitoxin VapB
MARTRTFKSGNSVAVRLPKSLGIGPGVDVSVREERGRYIVEPMIVEAKPGKIDLTGLYSSGGELAPMSREADDYEDLPREWNLLGIEPK